MPMCSFSCMLEGFLDLFFCSLFFFFTSLLCQKRSVFPLFWLHLIQLLELSWQSRWLIGDSLMFASRGFLIMETWKPRDGGCMRSLLSGKVYWVMLGLEVLESRLFLCFC